MPIKLRIKIVLLMARFESSVVVRRKLQVEFGKNRPTEACIKRRFVRFCETGTGENREYLDRPSKITEQKIDKVRDVIQHEPQSSVRAVATTYFIPPTTPYRLMSEYRGLKLFKMQFVEEGLQDRVDTCKTLIPMLQNKSTHENIIFMAKLLFIHMDNLIKATSDMGLKTMHAQLLKQL